MLQQSKDNGEEIYSALTKILEISHVLERNLITDPQRRYIRSISYSAKRLLELEDGFYSSEEKPDRPQILLVEDNKLIQNIHQKILHELGCAVDIAPTAKRALELANNHYSLILLDIGLPDMSGIEVAKVLHKCQIDVPMVALTSMDKQEIEQECMLAGIEKIMNKPAGLKEFEMLIASIRETA